MGPTRRGATLERRPRSAPSPTVLVSAVPVRATPAVVPARRNQRVLDRSIAPGVLVGLARRWLRRPGLRRSRLFADLWIELKCYGAAHVPDLDLSRIRGIERVRVDGPVWRHSPLVVTALATLLQSETIFDLGPDTADTSWLLAHNLPTAKIFWLDDGFERAREIATRGPDPVLKLVGAEDLLPPETSNEASRITRLHGDSSTVDLLPYSGSADLVYIEGSHRYERMRADTEAAFALLSELGCIVWDGYSGDAGVYTYLNALAPDLDRPLYHIRGTRLAFYSRWDVVVPDIE